jgi:hypothetical protein
VTSCCVRLTLKPEASRVALAVSGSWFVTSGTSEAVGPFEIVSVTVEPFAAEEPGAGVSASTVFAGWLESIGVVVTLKPCEVSCAVA